MTYGLPAFAGIFGGGAMLVIDKFLSNKYGLSFEDFGKWLDKELHLSPGSDIDLDSGAIEAALGKLLSIQKTNLAYDNTMKDLTKLFKVNGD